ncbi:MAG TPA: HEAT repeat domain-containing protein [Planctomycetota bacterium]|nr:HEAT repeat domain-containing protein [Planctomycetota bacterium]
MMIVLFLLAQDVSYGDVELANDLRQPALQGQAMDKVFAAGAKSLPAVTEFVERKGPNALILRFTERLGEIRDPANAKLLARLARNKDFFWRPAATWGLAEQDGADYRALFRELLGDPLWGVRQASILGLENLDDRESIPAVRKLLADSVFDVRAQAAKSLTEMGDESGLPVLIAALRDTTRWFDIDYGQFARETAFNFLKKYSGKDFGFKAWEPAAQREPGVKKWEEWIGKKFATWRELVPDTARAQQDPSEYLFGFELRSCQRGDYFFRVDVKGEIVLGNFNMVRKPLADGELDKFKAALQDLKAVSQLEPPGQPGCDYEKYYVLTPEGGYETPVVYRLGRPGALDAFIKASRALIRQHFGEGEAQEFELRAKLFREPD